MIEGWYVKVKLQQLPCPTRDEQLHEARNAVPYHALVGARLGANTDAFLLLAVSHREKQPTAGATKVGLFYTPTCTLEP